MRKLAIPISDRKQFLKLMEESEENFNLFINKIKNVPLSSSYEDINNFLETETDYSFLISNLYYSLATWEQSDSEFLDVLYFSYLESESEKKVDKELFYSRLNRLIDIKNNLRTDFKAQNLRTDFEKILFDLKILTDVRPIFDISDSSKFSGGVVTHQLRINYNEDGENREIYFSLDKNDLEKIGKVVDRAIKKETSIMKELDKTNLKII